MKMVTIKTDGLVEIVEHTGYDCLSKGVGGYIEALFIRHPLGQCTMYLNEEGKHHDLPFNATADFLARNFAGIGAYDCIVGNVCLVGCPDDQGNDTEVPEWAKQLAKKIGK